MNEYVLVFLGAAVVNNYVLTRFLGLCIFFGVSKSLSASASMGVAVVSVMTITSVIAWAVDAWILVPLGLEFMRTIVYVVLIACFVQLLEIVVKRAMPTLYGAWGIYLLLVATNCIMLGVPLLNAEARYGFAKSVVNALGSGAGFAFALVLMAGIREKMQYADVPRSLQGLGITFIVTGLLALAFQGFSGMIPL